MAIQLGNPATLELVFMQKDERGVTIGPMDLTDPEHDPIALILQKPDGTRVEILEAEIDITNAPAGEAEWTAAVGQLDIAGRWLMQTIAGEWKSRLRAFAVIGPNL